MPLVVQVVGTHGAGKTLALTKVLRYLQRHGRSVAVLKHSHHAIDLPGSDTDRLVRAGARAVVFASDRTVAFLPDDPIELALAQPVDVVLVEGYHRRRLGRRFRVRDPADAGRVAREIAEYLESALPTVRTRRRSKA